MKKFLIILTAMVTSATASQAAPTDSVVVVTNTKFNTTRMNEGEYILSKRAARTLAAAQLDIKAALKAVQAIKRPVIVKKKPIRVLRTVPQRAHAVDATLKKHMDRDTLPNEDRD